MAKSSAVKPRSRPSVISAITSTRMRRTDAQSSAGSARILCSPSRAASRAREPRLQAATTVRRPCFAQFAACADSCWYTLEATPVPAWVNTTPGRPPASNPPAPSGMP